MKHPPGDLSLVQRLSVQQYFLELHNQRHPTPQEGQIDASGRNDHHHHVHFHDKSSS